MGPDLNGKTGIKMNQLMENYALGWVIMLIGNGRIGSAKTPTSCTDIFVKR